MTARCPGDYSVGRRLAALCIRCAWLADRGRGITPGWHRVGGLADCPMFLAHGDKPPANLHEAG